MEARHRIGRELGKIKKGLTFTYISGSRPLAARLIISVDQRRLLNRPSFANERACQRHSWHAPHGLRSCLSVTVVFHSAVRPDPEESAFRRMNPVARGSDGLRTVQLAVAPYPEREGKRWATREDLLPEVLDGGNPLGAE